MPLETANKNNSENPHERASLIEKLMGFLKDTENQPLEVKPVEFTDSSKETMSKAELNKDLETLKRDNMSELDTQLYNVATNIVFHMQGLPHEKYKAVLDRMLLWGIGPTMETFIMEYYLVIKRDARLRQFIIIHFNKLLSIIENILNTNSILDIAKQDFSNDTDADIEVLRQKLNEKEKELIKVDPNKGLSIPITDVVRNENNKAAYKREVLTQLRESNPELEDL